MCIWGKSSNFGTSKKVVDSINYCATDKSVIIMNKKEMVSAIAEKTGLTKVASKQAMDAMLEVIGETLAKGENVAMIGFGNFSVNVRPERKGINPSTKKQIVIPEKKVIRFKAGSELNGKL